MKNALAVGCLFLSTTMAHAGWKLVWSDEFDQPGRPDPARWTYERGLVRNGEAQYYTVDRPENARVENGLLVIEARREDWPPDRKRASYTSASLTTKDRHAWAGGRIEARAKIPAARGTWPAIWMLGTNIPSVGWPACGEIDILEAVGHERDKVFGNLHTKRYNHRDGTAHGAATRVPDLAADFHLFAVEWFPDRIDFLVDDRRYFSVAKQPGDGPAEWPYDRPHYLILNLAIGGSWGGQKGIDETAFPQRFLIDYVRVYRAENGR